VAATSIGFVSPAISRFSCNRLVYALRDVSRGLWRHVSYIPRFREVRIGIVFDCRPLRHTKLGIIRRDVGRIADRPSCILRDHVKVGALLVYLSLLFKARNIVEDGVLLIERLVTVRFTAAGGTSLR
jgi:hypothetical protein